MSNRASSAREEIEKEIAKRLSKKHSAEANKDTAEFAVFEWFQRYEELEKLANTMGDSSRLRSMIKPMFQDLEIRLLKIDPGIKYDVIWSPKESKHEFPKFEGIKVEWSEQFAKDSNINREQYISLSELLLRFCM